MTNSSPKPPEENTSDRTGARREAMLRLLDRPLSDQMLREATNRVAQPLQRPNKDARSLLMFNAGSELLAFPVGSIQSVTRVAPTHRIPHRTNRVIRGVCHVNGELVLCGSLEALLDLQDASNGDTTEEQLAQDERMLVLADETGPWVVRVGKVHGVLSADPTNFLEPPLTVTASLRRYSRHIVQLDDDGLVTLLDPELVFAGLRAALS